MRKIFKNEKKIDLLKNFCYNNNVRNEKRKKYSRVVQLVERLTVNQDAA